MHLPAGVSLTRSFTHSAGQLAPLVLPESLNHGRPLSPAWQDADPIKPLHTTTAACAFSQHGRCMVKQAGGGSHNLLLTDLATEATVTVEWDSRQLLSAGKRQCGSFSLVTRFSAGKLLLFCSAAVLGHKLTQLACCTC